MTGETVRHVTLLPTLLLSAVGLACMRADSESRHPSEAKDPAIVLSTYLGGAADEMGRDVAVDQEGNIFVAGSTRSPDFPVTAGAYDTRFHTGGVAREMDGFVTKFSPAGKIVWSTLLGGPNYERIYALELDPEGYIVVAGRGGAGMPTTAGVFQQEFGGGEGKLYGPQDGFVCKITPDGAKLVFCTYLGTGDNGIIRDVAVDRNGDIYVAAGSETGDYPEEWFRNAFQKSRAGGVDVLVAKIKSDGSRVLWATYLGGTGEETGAPSIRVDSAGAAYLLLTTRSSDLPTPNGFDHTLGGAQDLYVAKISPDGSRLIYGTYVGGSSGEDIETHGLAVDREGNAYVAAGTSSPDLPTSPASFQPNHGGQEGDHNTDAFVVKIAPDGRLLAATYLGGSAHDYSEGLTVDSAGDVYLTGVSDSPDFPVTSRNDQGTSRGLIAVKLSSDLRHLLFSMRVGGSTKGIGRAVAVGSDGRFYATGHTQTPDWPIRNAAQQGLQGPWDALLIGFLPPTDSASHPR